MAFVAHSARFNAVSRPIVAAGACCARAANGQTVAPPSAAIKSRRLMGYPSYQLHPLQTGMPVLADDDVVVHGNAKRSSDIDDRFRHLDVGLRRCRIAGGMVVDQDNSRGR